MTFPGPVQRSRTAWVDNHRHEKTENRKKYKKKYYADNFEHRKIIIKSYQNKRKEYLSKKALEWRKRNPGRIKAAWAKSRAKRLKRIVSHRQNKQ